MPQSESVITGRVKLEGIPEATSTWGGFMDIIRAGVGGMNTGSLAVRSPLAPGAPQAPAPPIATSSPFSPSSPLNPANLANPAAYALPGLLGAGGYAAGSQSIIPAAPPPPGQRNIGPSLASNGFPGTSLSSSMPLTINVQVVTINAQTVNLLGGNMAGSTTGSGNASAGGGGSSSAGSGRGSSSFGIGGGGANVASGGSGGGAGGNGNSTDLIPDAPPPGDGPSWGKFWGNVRKNPSINGILDAARNELPIGGAAAIGATMYGLSYAGNAIYAGQRPRFENELSQTSAMLRGQYTPSAILAGQSRAAEIRGSIAYDKSLLAPFNSATLGLAGLAYDFSTGQPREEMAMRAESESIATQSIRQLSALSHVSNAELLKRFGTTRRKEDELGFFGNMQRIVGQSAKQWHVRGFGNGGNNNIWNSTAAGLDNATFHLFSGAADNGVHDETVLDEDATKFMPSMLSMQRLSLGLGQGFDDRLWTDPKRFKRAFGKSSDIFGAEGVMGAYGQVGNSMANDATQVGLYAPGTNFASPENARLAAQIAASRGQDVSGFAAAFYQNSDMATFNSLRDTRRSVQMLENRGRIAGYQTSTAQYGYQSLGLTGADFPALQKQIDVERTGIQASMRAKQEEARFAITDSDKARIENELAAFRVRLDSNAHQRLDVEFGSRSTRLGAEGMRASTGFQRALYSGADADGLDVAFGAQANNSRSRAALLRKQAQRADVDPATRAQYAAQADAADFEANVMSPRQASLNRYGLDMAGAGVTGARAGQMGSRARLFGGPQEQAASVRAEADETAQQLKAVTDLLGRSGNSLEEIRKLTAQQIGLQTRQVELAQEEIRGKAQAEYSLASGRAGLAGTEQQTAYTMGVGGAAGGRLALGTLNAQKQATQKAQAYLTLLQQQGVSRDNPAYLQAQQTLASAKQQEAGATLALGSTPYSVGLRRTEENASYESDILSSLPGSYGNLRGSLRKQIGAYRDEAGELKAQYQQAAQEAGGEENVPEALRERFEQRMHSLGRSALGAQRQLSYGWESKIVSQALGTGGSWGYIQNRIGSDRNAVLNGVKNPHYGVRGADLGAVLHEATGDIGRDFSLSGSTGTPQGFARTALTGAKQRNDFSEGGAFPLHIAGGGAAQGGYGGSAGAGRGGTDASRDGGIKKIEIQLVWPDKSPAGKASINVDKLSLGASEDAANFFSQQMRGNN